MKKTKARREHRENQENPVLAVLKPIVIGAVAGAGVCMVLLLICSFALVSSKHLPQAALQPITVAVAAVGSFFAGWIAAKISRERGILFGSCASLVLFLILLMAGLTVGDEMLTPVTATKGLIMVLTGAIAGILAVNKKTKRK